MSLVSHHTCCKHWKVSVELKPNSITKTVPLKPVQQSNESLMRRVIMSCVSGIVLALTVHKNKSA